jgi:hypothetical protein
LMLGVLQTSCFGEYALTRKLYTFNAEISDKGTLMGRFINHIVFWGLCVIQVYTVVIFIDEILNTIEFWTGSNPMAMEEGEMEQQMVKRNGEEYLITATKNQFLVQQLQNGAVLEEAVLQYCPDDMSWSAIKDGESHFLNAFKGLEGDQAVYDVMTSEGLQTVKLDVNRI